MKSVIVLFCFVLLADSHVLSRAITEATTQIIQENVTKETFINRSKDSDSQINRNDNGSSFKDVPKRIYLNDVLFALSNQNWTKDEELCMNQTVILLNSLQNFTLWAVWQWDAQSSQPQGLLFGNRYQLGNFDECMNAPWAETYPNLRTKYCLADIQLERTDHAVRKRTHRTLHPYQSALDYIEYIPPNSNPLNQLTWGACAPAVCSPKTIEKLLSIMLARSHLGAAGMRANISITEPCQTYDEQKEYDWLFYAFVIMTGILVVICLICSYLNNRTDETKSTKSIFVQSFCMKSNTKDLLNIKESGLEVFYGIRFLSICVIVLDHHVGISNGGPISDRFIMDPEQNSSIWLWLLHNDLFVDTFFLLSGLLTVVYIAEIKRFPNPFLAMLRRYLRLVVGLAVVIFYLAAVYQYTGSGPLWARAVAGDTLQCRKNWWLNLLMVQNYVDVDNICHLITWYIPCDFHFFVVTMLLHWVYRRRPKVCLLCVTVLGIVAIILPGVITYIYELPPVLLFTLKFLSNPRLGAGPVFPLTYVPSHTRYAAYLVGTISGYFFVTHYKAGSKRLSKKWSILGVVVAFTIMIAVMLSGSMYLWRSHSALEGAVYASLNRPVWASAVALFVGCCAFGQVPLIAGFLSWRVWVPLSRLSYGLYLTHTIIITRNVYVARNPQHNDYFEIVNATAGTIFWGCIAALLIWLLAEAPANKLFVLFSLPKNRQQKKIDEPNPLSTPAGSGHLQDNMSSTTYLSKI